MLSVWAVTMSQEKHLLEKEQLALLKADGMTSINSHCKYAKLQSAWADSSSKMCAYGWC